MNNELNSTTEILPGYGTAEHPIHHPGQSCDVCDSINPRRFSTISEINAHLEGFRNSFEREYGMVDAAFLRFELPLDWPEFNRRAKAYFRQRVAERRHERNRRENTYSLRVKEIATIRNPR